MALEVKKVEKYLNVLKVQGSKSSTLFNGGSIPIRQSVYGTAYRRSPGSGLFKMVYN